MCPVLSFGLCGNMNRSVVKTTVCLRAWGLATLCLLSLLLMETELTTKSPTFARRLCVAPRLPSFGDTREKPRGRFVAALWLELSTRLSAPDTIRTVLRSIRARMERRFAPCKRFLALRLHDHNADSIPRLATKTTWWKVREGDRAQVAGVEPKVIEEKLAGSNCAATRERELIRGTVGLRISLNDDRSPDNRLAVLRKGVCQKRFAMRGELFFAV